MARYRLARPAYVVVDGHPLPRVIKGGEQITVADDMVPGETWQPLDKAAHDAVAARRAARGFTVAPNGLQTIDNGTGQVRVKMFR